MTMTIPQTTYGGSPVAAYPGMVADIGHAYIVSRVIELAAGIDAGLFVVDGTIPGEQVLLPTATGDITSKLCGVLVLDMSKMPSSPRHARYAVVGVLKRGQIWVPYVADPGISAGDPTVCVDHATTDAGKIQGVVGAGPEATVIPNGAAKCIKVDAATGLALVQLNLP